MGDPFSVAGGAVGVISLGITVAQGLYNYYTTYRDQGSSIAHTTRKLSTLSRLLQDLREQLEDSKAQAITDDKRSSLEPCIKDCETLIGELKEELDKFERISDPSTISKIRVTGRRIAYPLRQSTLQKLDEDIDDLVSCLSLALQILQQSDTKCIKDDLGETKDLLELVMARQVDSTIRDWLKAPDATIDLNNAIEKKHPGTGSWLIKGNAFKTWLQTPNSFLWLVGFAGCGKSVLCSTAIRSAFQHRRGNLRVGIAFFFFSFRDESKQDAPAMLRALVLQLSSQLNEKHAFLSPLHNSYRNASPPSSALMDCLHQLIRAFDDVYIALDALDESPVKGRLRTTMLKCVREIRDWSEPSLHLMVSSRDEVDIRRALSVKPEDRIDMRNTSIDADIASFISDHLRQEERLQDWVEHHDRIETELAARARGMFRWVECQFEALAECPATEELLEQLLNSLPETLYETYEQMLSRIPSSCKSFARQMLMILCTAQRPLRVTELIDLIAVELDHDPPRFNPKRRLRDAQAVQKVCPGFTEVYVDLFTRAATIRIAHFSVQEYLESEEIRSSKDAAAFSVRPQDADAQTTRVCMTLILEPGFMTSMLEFKSSLYYSQILDDVYYPVRYWPVHLAKSGELASVDAQILRLFEDEVLFKQWVRIWNIDDRSGELNSPDIPAPLYYASLLGLNSIVLILLHEASFVGLHTSGNGHDNHKIRQMSTQDTQDNERVSQNSTSKINAPGGTYGTALGAASANGHGQIVQLLLDKGADINAASGKYESALGSASANGHGHIVQLLLDSGAHIDTKNEASISALQAASRKGHKQIVQLLLDKGADVNASDGTMSALHEASKRGHHQIVRMLLDKAADINAEGVFGSALVAALKVGDDHMVRILLDKGADINASNGNTGALEKASRGGHDKIVQMLLEKGADIEAEGSFGNALQAASFEGHNQVIQKLLDNGANVNAKGKHGSALFMAARGGRDQTVRFLLDKGADVNGGGSLNPLYEALARGFNKVARILYEKGSDTNVLNNAYKDKLQRLLAEGPS